MSETKAAAETVTVKSVVSAFLLDEKKAVFLKEDANGKYAEVITAGKSPVLGLADGVTITLTDADFGEEVTKPVAGTKLYFTGNQLTGIIVPTAQAARSAASTRSSGAAHHADSALFEKQH